MSVAWFGWEREIFFKVQLYTPTFRNRKGGQKIFAAQTPQRKRGYVEDFALNSNFYVFIILTGVTALLLRYVRVTFGEIAARQARGWGWFPSKCFGKHGSTLMPCHAAVCANFVLGSNVQLLRVITQSIGLDFLPRLPIGKKLGSNSTFMFSKKLCAKFYTTHRVIFFITLYFLISIACSRTCSDLSQPPAFWWLTVQAGGTEYPVVFF